MSAGPPSWRLWQRGGGCRDERARRRARSLGAQPRSCARYCETVLCRWHFCPEALGLCQPVGRLLVVGIPAHHPNVAERATASPSVLRARARCCCRLVMQCAAWVHPLHGRTPASPSSLVLLQSMPACCSGLALLAPEPWTGFAYTVVGVGRRSAGRARATAHRGHDQAYPVRLPARLQDASCPQVAGGGTFPSMAGATAGDRGP